MSKRYPGGIIRKTPQTPSQTSAQGIWDMASVTQAVKENTWPIAGVPDPISKSLRFRASATAYLNRTGSTVTNANLATYSFWMKRGILTTGQWLFTGGTTTTLIGFNGSSDSLSVLGSDSSGEGNITTAVFRDPSAWYHVVIAIDTSQATTADRAKIYVNGVQQAVSVSNGGINLNSNWGFNTAGSLAIGRYSPVPGSYFDGYLAEVYFIGGVALTPSSFGNTNDQTGVWQPIAYTGTYGTNGFYLPFSNTASTATLGYDFSGNSNNWTTNNISLTSGSTYDSMVDVPTQWIPYNTAGDTGALFRGNYATLNPLQLSASGSPATSNGNLRLSSLSPSGYPQAGCTFGTAINGFKGYFEVTLTGGNDVQVGFNYASAAITNTDYTSTGCIYVNSTGNLYNNNLTVVQSSYITATSTGGVIMIAFDFTGSNKNIWWGYNGTWGTRGGVGNPATGANPGITVTEMTSAATRLYLTTGGSPATPDYNFGQQPFAYTPPTGFVALNTFNLPTPTIGATASTTANKYFDISLYTGNNGTQSITNSGSMQPDFVWTKSRSTGSTNHLLEDVIRGTKNSLISNGANTELARGINAFLSNGFSFNDDAGGDGNVSGQTYVGWQWKANGAGSSNTAGSITSTVSANTTAGFSIVTYTGTGGTGTTTVGHGCQVGGVPTAPSMVIIKRRNSTADWATYHTGLTSTSYYLVLNSTAGQANYGSTFISPSSSTLTIDAGSSLLNTSTGTYVAYCFAQVAGYSAFGSYTGNGVTDGPFIYTGFRPRFVMIKRTSSGTTGNWNITDTAINPYNNTTGALRPNTAESESTVGTVYVQPLSNGFKITNNNTDTNGSSTYIYMAFAENPFKYALAR